MQNSRHAIYEKKIRQYKNKVWVKEDYKKKNKMKMKQKKNEKKKKKKQEQQQPRKKGS